MKTSYLKTHLLNDLILACVLIVTGYCWFQLFGDEDKAETDHEADITELLPVSDDMAG